MTQNSVFDKITRIVSNGNYGSYGNIFRHNNNSQNEITMLTVKYIQKIFKCGLKQAYALVNANGFPTIRIGNKILVEKKALEQWLDKNKGKNIIL